MTSFKLAVVAALSSFAVSAFALSPMQDSDLSAVSGQDGVSIAANLNIDVGSFVYTDTANGAQQGGAAGSIHFNGIEIRGAIAAEIDIISAAGAKGILQAAGATGTDTFTTAFLPTGDVVRIALPDVALVAGAAGVSKATAVVGADRKTNNLYIGVKSIEMGNAVGKSFGAFAVNDIKMQGTSMLIWAH